MATKEPSVVAGAHVDSEPEFSNSEMMIVREKIYIREKIYLIFEISCLVAIDDGEA